MDKSIFFMLTSLNFCVRIIFFNVLLIVAGRINNKSKVDHCFLFNFVNAQLNFNL